MFKSNRKRSKFDGGYKEEEAGFPFMFLIQSFDYTGDMDKDIVVMQKSISLLVWSFLLNCLIELVQLLNVELHLECFVAFKQFLKKYAFPSHHTQY